MGMNRILGLLQMSQQAGLDFNLAGSTQANTTGHGAAIPSPIMVQQQWQKLQQEQQKLQQEQQQLLHRQQQQHLVHRQQQLRLQQSSVTASDSQSHLPQQFSYSASLAGD